MNVSYETQKVDPNSLTKYSLGIHANGPSPVIHLKVRILRVRCSRALAVILSKGLRLRLSSLVSSRGTVIFDGETECHSC